jgi:transcriptional regulator with XRE-family HTH domain
MMRNEQERLRMGERIATLRKAVEWTDELGIHRTGMTQTELAERTGLQRSHIVRLEQGRYGVSIDVLAVIADALGCKVELVDKDY